MKIISDNQNESIDFKNKEDVYRLIINHKKLIDDLCLFLLKLKNKMYPIRKEIIDYELNKLFGRIEFTFTEREQIKALLGLYFTKYDSFQDNILNFSKNGAYNVKKLKEFLEI